MNFWIKKICFFFHIIHQIRKMKLKGNWTHWRCIFTKSTLHLFRHYSLQDGTEGSTHEQDVRTWDCTCYYHYWRGRPRLLIFKFVSFRSISWQDYIVKDTPESMEPYSTPGTSMKMMRWLLPNYWDYAATFPE